MGTSRTSGDVGGAGSIFFKKKGGIIFSCDRSLLKTAGVEKNKKPLCKTSLVVTAGDALTYSTMAIVKKKNYRKKKIDSDDEADITVEDPTEEIEQVR